MSIHEQCLGASDEWYTPPFVFEAMGVTFDIDVAHPGGDLARWVPAASFITADSLASPWSGFVWMNPPFGGRNGLEPWLEKFFDHGNGVALVPDRSSAPWWHRANLKADAVLVVGKPHPTRGAGNKIRFLRPDGSEGSSPAQGTHLFAAGQRGVQALLNAERAGLGTVMARLSRKDQAR